MYWVLVFVSTIHQPDKNQPKGVTVLNHHDIIELSPTHNTWSAGQAVLIESTFDLWPYDVITCNLSQTFLVLHLILLLYLDWSKALEGVDELEVNETIDIDRSETEGPLVKQFSQVIKVD